MARLNFEVFVKPQNSPAQDSPAASRYIYFNVFNTAGNVSGTPQVKVNSGSWQTMSFSSSTNRYFLNFTNLTAGETYTIWYRDNRGERIAINVFISTWAAACGGPGGISPGWTVRVLDASVTVQHSITSETSLYPYQYSNNNGSTWQGNGIFSYGSGATGPISVILSKTATGCITPAASGILIAQFPTLDLTVSKTNVSLPGGNNGAIDITPTGGTAPYTYSWSDGPTTQDRTDLVSGNYTVTVTDAGGLEKIASVEIYEPSELVVSFVKTNETSSAANDGTITVTPSGGGYPAAAGQPDPVYLIAWSDGTSTAFTRTNLEAGNYVAVIVEALTGQQKTIEVEITEPAPVVPVGTILDVPEIQSLRFVRSSNGDSCTDRRNFHNRLLCKEDHYKHWKTSYYQKVEKCLPLQIMFYSNYPAHLIELYSLISGDVVKTFQAQLTQELTGLEQEFDIYITANPADSTKSRVYFQSGAFPLPLTLGDVFEIFNNADAFNGSYEIVGIQTDSVLGSQYLLINKTYDIADPSSTAEGRFTTNVLDFDVYEFVMNLGDVANGYYFVSITATNDDGSQQAFISEPLWLKEKHDGTHLIEFRNADNAFGMVYTTGIVSRLWVESQFYKVLGGGEDENYRESSYRPVKLVGKAALRILFETFGLPGYLHHKLNVVFRHDYVTVNGVQYHADEGYAEPSWRARYPLANSSITLEQVDLFKDFNGDDLGMVPQTGYIKANGGYLRR